MKHLLYLKDLNKKTINQILDTAENFLDYDNQPFGSENILEDKTLANLFFEPSTRTRNTFEIASKKLGADVINIDEDTNIEAYADSYGEAQEVVPNNDRDILYYIQVGAFSEKRAAINLKARLALMGYESVVMTAEIGVNTFHRVSVGPYKNYDDAKDNREKLFLEGFKANLIKLTTPKDY